MKITEVVRTQRQALQESLAVHNDTGFATEDLMKIYDTHINGDWDCVDADDEIARIEEMIAKDAAAD